MDGVDGLDRKLIVPSDLCNGVLVLFGGMLGMVGICSGGRFGSRRLGGGLLGGDRLVGCLVVGVCRRGFGCLGGGG